jgi:hypothetical protein
MVPIGALGENHTGVLSSRGKSLSVFQENIHIERTFSDLLALSLAWKIVKEKLKVGRKKNSWPISPVTTECDVVAFERLMCQL